MRKWVYKFHEGNADMRELLGGKGANLAEMTNLGMPIPQGFTITTEACTDYYANEEQIREEIQTQIFEAVGWLEQVNGKKFGDNANPLLVSVRSGARASMPGMMDQWKDLQKRPAIRALHMIRTEDLSRCFPMLSWKCRSLTLKRLLTRSRQTKKSSMIRN